jgi:hypothetical protein
MPDLTTPLLSEWDDWRKRPSNDFIHQVQRGRAGENVGLSTGSAVLDKYTHGIHPGTYYLIGADSGVGKTTLTDFIFIFNAWISAKKLGRKLHILYCSFEISKVSKIARWCSYFIFYKYKVRLPSSYILGRIHGKLVSEEHMVLIKEAYTIIQELFDIVQFVDMNMHPTMIFYSTISFYEKRGKITRLEVTEQEKKKGKLGKITHYEPDDPNEMVMLVADHIALSDEEEGAKTIKTIMDKLSRYGVILRNIFNTCIVFIQQFSTDMLSAMRALQVKKTELNLAPTRLDFGDSKATYRDANVVFAGVCPGKDLSTFMEWDLSPGGLGTHMILFYIIKNRDGFDNKIVPLFRDGVTGTIYDLPCPAGLCDADEWYNKAKEINEICQVYSPQSQ